MNNHEIPQPIPNETALYLKKQKTLVIADLHIGIESKLQQNGLHIPSQTPHMITRILQLIRRYQPQNLIILGDIKHTIPTMTIQERYDVKQFLHILAQHINIHIIPGNHDGNLKWLIPPNTTLHPRDGYQKKRIGYIHGHSWPRTDLLQSTYLLMGHTHPTIQLTDRLGFSSYETCWIKGYPDKQIIKQHYGIQKTPKILILPAFNPLCGGIAINQEKPLGPLANTLSQEKTEVFLIDGTSLGTLALLKKMNHTN